MPTPRYRPPALLARVVVSLNVLMVALAVVRGVDWLDVAQPAAFSALLLDLGVPLRVWGGLLVGGAGVLLVGLVSRVHLVVWAGHVSLAAVYAGLVVTIGVAVLALGGGWFQLVPAVGGAAWHTTLAGSTGARPRRNNSGAARGQQHPG